MFGVPLKEPSATCASPVYFPDVASGAEGTQLIEAETHSGAAATEG